MRLFLDCEWADLLETELVSIALVGEDGSSFFYAECEQLPAPAPLFVQQTVYPLLERGVAAMSALALTRALRDFVGAASNPILVADYPLDFELFRSALDGTGLLASERMDLGPAPDFEMQLATGYSLQAAIEARFSTDPMVAAHRHHALVDARVLRDAWLSMRTSS
ncbi:3'-5' exoribonuclease [Xanthomonas euvesicatoria]|uniref:3'-5' exoribonuclease n=1 Tax=Xanthomonas TaxID=338 RepID=UPI0009384D7E|nr:3'-5' exoribonuclease [Xanthomonas euvesicatoria]APO88868.1 hypothetical protein BJD11_01485 [Xanthomonas euvesicatoria]MCC8514510.1 3'-5' exoribonuclease [Xanthomonas euvesicatoria pv. euvesicatoria]MCC8546805.1 3'-5' exoribonuclease [Xanthomonas euvesicatoria pv. euvesicatoria]MCC8584976.1 3'-5' exoribonuclease [Xanthomonas euvesicatoria pv. euvesicatoria]MCC8591391.1 3'-5' exoribonuclease [Xanthomonas euvesicatoria pv. euvesicatoria]